MGRQLPIPGAEVGEVLPFEIAAGISRERPFASTRRSSDDGGRAAAAPSGEEVCEFQRRQAQRERSCSGRALVVS
jgi:hypothetical protein